MKGKEIHSNSGVEMGRELVKSTGNLSFLTEILFLKQRK
jgi:hypothetical protein